MADTLRNNTIRSNPTLHTTYDNSDSSWMVYAIAIVAMLALAFAAFAWYNNSAVSDIESAQTLPAESGLEPASGPSYQPGPAEVTTTTSDNAQPMVPMDPESGAAAGTATGPAY